MLIISILSSCCLFIKDKHSSDQSPSEVVSCFLDAIIDGDYEVVAFYISDESGEMIYEFAYQLNDLREFLDEEMKEIINDILEEYELTVENLYNMTPEELIAVILAVGVEILELDSYEIISESIEGNSAKVKVIIDTETEILLVKQNGLWKICFEF